MLARFLRLSLLFESFAYLLLGVGLVRLSGWSPWAALLLAIVLALAGRAGVVTFSYLNAYVHRHAAGGGRGPQWQEVAREIWAFVASIFVEAFDTLLMRADAPRRVADGAHEAPLLLVHGYGCNRGYWWWLKPRLEARGRSVATLSLEPIHGDIDAYAEQIARRVAWLRERSGAQRVTLVGHSMGGLACLAYLRRYGEDSVAKLITLGTPHRGSTAIRMAFGRNARQMEPGAAWLAELAAFFVEMPLGVPCIAYYSPQDNMVLPPGHAMRAGADNRPLDGVGHVSMGMSPRVLAELLVETDGSEKPRASSGV